MEGLVVMPHRNTLMAVTTVFFSFVLASCSQINPQSADGVSLDNESSSALVGGTEVNARMDLRSRALAVLASTIMTKEGKAAVAACTGTAISDRVVLTAGHCVLGAKNIRLRFEAAKDRFFQTKNYVVHPDYKQKGSPDIALIFVNEKIPSAVVRAQLAHPDTRLKSKQTMVTYGFGIYQVIKSEYLFGVFTSTEKLRDQKLRYGTFKLIASPDTNPIKKDDQVYPLILTHAQGKSMCQGDSGGPTFIPRKDVVIQVGVNSFISSTQGGEKGKKQIEKCDSSINGVVDVRFYLDWIQKVSSKSNQRIKLANGSIED